MLKFTITFLFVGLACVTRTTMACSCVSNIKLADDFRRSALVTDATVVAIEDASVEWRQFKGWVMSGFDRKALSWTEFGGAQSQARSARGMEGQTGAAAERVHGK